MAPVAGPGPPACARRRAVWGRAGLAVVRAGGGRQEPEAASRPTGGGSGEPRDVEARLGAGRARQPFPEKDADARLGDAQPRSQRPRPGAARGGGDLAATAGHPRGPRKAAQGPPRPRVPAPGRVPGWEARRG